MAENTSIVDQIREKEKEAEKTIAKAKDAVEAELAQMRTSHEKKLMNLEDDLKEEKVTILEQTKAQIKKKKIEFEARQAEELKQLETITDAQVNDAAALVKKAVLNAAE